MASGEHHIVFFGLSTCIHCRHTKEFLDEHHIAYELVWVDLLQGAERSRMIKEIKGYNPQVSFPTLVIDEGKEVVVGFQRDVLIRELQIGQESAKPAESPYKVTDPIQKLYGQLKTLQEPKGYYLNKNMAMTMPLLEQLLVTREKYGYMACPCRVANGSYEEDKDIICPCIYRAADVEEYEACFCGLYVSQRWNEDEDEREVYVPDRRPPIRILR